MRSPAMAADPDDVRPDGSHCWDFRGNAGRDGCWTPIYQPVEARGDAAGKVAHVPAVDESVQASLRVAAASHMGAKKELVVACTLPFWNYEELEATLPGLFTSWLYYHIVVLGINRFQVYDTDGSFQAVLAPWIARGQVTYVPKFNELVSHGLFGVLAEEGKCQGCIRGLAEDHCLYSNKHRSEWVILLRSFDKFLNSPKLGDRQDFRHFLASLKDNSNSYLLIDRVDYGMDPGSQDDELQRDVHPIERHIMRCEKGTDGYEIPMVRPENALYIGESRAITVQHRLVTHPWRGLLEQPFRVPTEVWQANHYIDILGRRCACCDREDTRLLWAVPYLAPATQAPFRIGDKVLWTEFDDDVPKGTVGEVIAHTHPGLARVKFPNATDDFNPEQLHKALTIGDSVTIGSADDVAKETIGLLGTIVEKVQREGHGILYKVRISDSGQEFLYMREWLGKAGIDGLHELLEEVR